MTRIKSYTELEQSKKLVEILPIESADMFYADLFVCNEHKYIVHPLESYGFKTFKDTKERTSKRLNFIPCWSLAALLSVLPNGNMLVKGNNGRYYCLSKDVMTKYYDNPVDACVEMILKLRELNLL